MGIGIKLASLITTLEARTENFEQGIGKARGLTQSFASNIQTVGKAALVGLGTGLTAAAGGAAALGGAMLKMASDAAPLVNVKSAFDGISESVGRSGDEMLAAFDKATAGMVDHESAMLSFNKAAQLVGTDFAVQLPDAMGYLGKVAAATGQDMGYMLDSLVVGVGRLSPMILDNLGIQVTLADATARAAEMYGVEADALTKAQQQAGMMSVVLDKLAKNTAAMPDITQSAAGQMESLKNAIKNTKEAAGMALVPALQKLLAAFNPIIQKALPQIVSLFQDKLGPILEKAVGWIEVIIEIVQEWFGRMQEGEGPIEALGMALWDLGFEDIGLTIKELQNKFDTFIDGVKNAIAVVEPYITLAWDWIKQNVELKDVLIALGIAILSVVVPAIVSLVASFAPIILAIVAVIAIVAVLRKVWEEHGEAIRAKAIEIWGAVQGFITTAIEVIKTVVDVALNAIKAFWEKHGADILAVIQSFWGLIQAIYERVVTIIKGIIDMFHSDGESSWSAFGEVIKGIVEVLWKVLGVLFDTGLKLLKILFDTFAAIFKGDWEAVWEGIKAYFETIWDGIKSVAETVWDAISGAFDSFKSTLQPIANAIKGFFENIAGAIGAITGAIQTVVGWIDTFLAKLGLLLSAAIPDWLKPGSPPPLAYALWDIARAGKAAAEALGTDMKLAISTDWNKPGLLTQENGIIKESTSIVNLTINNPIADAAGPNDYYTALALL